MGFPTLTHTTPLSNEEILAKFRRQVDFSQSVKQENADKLLELLGQLEKVDNLNEIVALTLK